MYEHNTKPSRIRDFELREIGGNPDEIEFLLVGDYGQDGGTGGLFARHRILSGDDCTFSTVSWITVTSSYTQEPRILQHVQEPVREEDVIEVG